MQRLRSLLNIVLWEFGPLIILLALSSAFGLRVAIAGTIAFIVMDAMRRLWSHIPFTRIYLLSSGLAVVFGAIDILSQTPFMLKYEAVITNVATGVAFVAGAHGEKPMLQEIAEQRGAAFPDRADTRQFFRLFTLLWAAYFFAKAGAYLWLAPSCAPAMAMLVTVRSPAVSVWASCCSLASPYGPAAVLSLPSHGSVADSGGTRSTRPLNTRRERAYGDLGVPSRMSDPFGKIADAVRCGTRGHNSNHRYLADGWRVPAFDRPCSGHYRRLAVVKSI